MKVRAIKDGYYGHKRRRVGAVFMLAPITRMREDKKTGAMKEVTISPEQQFSTRWMEKVDAGVPEYTPTAKDEKKNKGQLAGQE